MVMALEHYKDPDIVLQILKYSNIVFTCLYTLEAVVKLIGLRFYYFGDCWNVFDFTIVVLSIVAGWNDILDGLLVSEPYCDPRYRTLPDGKKDEWPYGDCGIEWLAIPYMVSYIVHQQEEMGITKDHLNFFFAMWFSYDQHHTQFIPFDVLPDFLDNLEKPFRVPKPNHATIDLSWASLTD
nr:hypothetical protein BaRGS_023025 [Batillaria attramentaria]